MKVLRVKKINLFLEILILFFIFTPASYSKDMRADYKILEEKKAELLKKSEYELEDAKKEAAKREKRIKSDKERLTLAIKNLEKEKKRIRLENKRLEAETEEIMKIRKSLETELEKNIRDENLLSDSIKSSNKNLNSLLLKSFEKGADSELSLNEGFPSMKEIENIKNLLFKEINESGQVRVKKGVIVDKKGNEKDADLLLIGNFTGLYKFENKTGFFLKSEKSGRFFALSKPPERKIRKNIKSYLNGKSDDLFIDITGGSGLRQIINQPDLKDRIKSGGVIVWPILMIPLLAFFILIERIFFFLKKQINIKPFMGSVEEFIYEDKWEECLSFLKSCKKKILPKVLLGAADFRNLKREDMENALQESILGEIPKIERFVSTLGILAAIAPLLGLLGTVTGMINTFHSITFSGTSNPKLMSGGISEALVTTMLGLTAAIPVMFFHSILSRKVEREIALIEEKGVSFINMIFKARS